MTERVFVAVSRGGGGSSVYHTDRDCTALARAHNVGERRRAYLPEGVTECARCAGRLPETSGRGAGHYESLKAAAEDG